MLEQELKLAVTGRFAPEFPPGRSDVAGVEELPALDLRATYYDTDDLRLARNGVTLRCRSGEDGPQWTLKLPAGDGNGRASERDELHFEGGRRQVPEAAHDLVLALARAEPLVPVARLRTRRRRWLLRAADGVEMAELVDDRVSVLDRGRVVERFREVEIEGRNVDQDTLERIAGVLSEDGVTPAAQTPKVVRALGSRAEAAPDVAATAPPGPGDPAAGAVQAAIAAAVRRMVLNDARTRLGEMEPLHQMRVGTRRLRSDLRTFQPLLDEQWTEPLRRDLKWLGASLGAVRDLDVLLERLRQEGSDLPALKPLLRKLERRRERARADLLEDLRSERYVDLLERLVEAAHRPRLEARAQEASGKVLPGLAAKPWRKLARTARTLTDESPAEDYHRVRVLAKRARYAAEAVAPALGARRRDAERFAKRTARVQDDLGELQDSAVAAETIDGFAHEHPADGALNLAAGRMLEREARAAAVARGEFPRLWRRLDLRKRRAWMR